MADWAAFATAFMKDTAGYINERKDKAEDYEEKQRDLAEKNLIRMQKRQQIAGSVKGIAQRLISQGVPEDVVRTAAAAGPAGLTDLDAKWGKAINQYGQGFASSNPELVSTMVSTNLNAEQLGMGTGEGATTLDEFINSQYGLSKTTTGDYKAEETGVFKRLMGYGATDRARQRLDEEMAGMGMSVYDINQAAQMSDFESAVPGASVMYGKMPSKFTADDMGAELTEYNRIEANLKTKPEYIAAQAKLKALIESQVEEKSMIETNGRKLYDEATKKVNEQLVLLEKLKDQAYGPLVRAKSENYFGSSYLDVMGGVLGDRLSSNFLNSLREAPEVGAGEAPEVAAGVNDQGEPVTAVTDPAILRGTPHYLKKTPEGPVIVLLEPLPGVEGMGAGTEIPVDQTAKLLGLSSQSSDSIEPFVPPTPEAFEAAREELGTIPLTPEQYDSLSDDKKEELGLRTGVIGQSIDQAFGGGLANPNYTKSVAIQETADPDKTYRVYIPQFAGKTRYFAVKGSDLKYFSKARLADNQKAAVIIEGEAKGDERSMSTKRLERKFGRPFDKKEEAPKKKRRPSLGDRAGVNKEKAEGEVSNNKKKRPSSFNARGDRAGVNKKVRSIPADEDQEKVLKEHGYTLMRYMQDRGLTNASSDRAIEKALSEWSFENQVEMPLNRNAMIYALKQFIGDGE